MTRSNRPIRDTRRVRCDPECPRAARAARAGRSEAPIRLAAFAALGVAFAATGSLDAAATFDTEGALEVAAAIAPSPIPGARPQATVPRTPGARSAVASRDGDVWVEREVHAMGTRLRVRVAAADRETAIRASEAVLRDVRETDELLSTWRPGTALAALNAAPVNRRVAVAPALIGLLDEIAARVRETGGAFDPAVGALIDAWDLRGEGRVPSAARLARARAATGFGCFELDLEAMRAKRSCAEAWLDAGAFGKGAALRRARRTLESMGARSAHIDFGGQQLAYGSPDREGSWTVDVAHPVRRDEAVARLRIAAGSVATTGQSERAVHTPRGRFGHVLDPRSGRPVPAWGSVTVVADDALDADLLSTALFVMGPSAGAAWLAGRPDIAALFVVNGPQGLSLRPSEAMRPLIVASRDPADAAPPPRPTPTGSVPARRPGRDTPHP